MTTKWVIANWKMNHLRAEASAFCEAFRADYKARPGVEAGIAPSFPLLPGVISQTETTGAKVFGQNAHWEPKGAFTGAVSMAQLKDAGCHGVILGHSERRQFFNETDDSLVKKLQAAWEFDLLPVLCIGETLTQRDAGFTLDVLRQQLSVLERTGHGPLVVAYEPVWAIGTGRRADATQIEEVHAFIREDLWLTFGDAGREIPILYGGSVTPDNFEEILRIRHVAGGLVGGASLEAGKFLRLLKQAQESN